MTNLNGFVLKFHHIAGYYERIWQILKLNNFLTTCPVQTKFRNFCMKTVKVYFKRNEFRKKKNQVLKVNAP